MTRQRRVCIYGGTNVPEPGPTFVAVLARTILESAPSPSSIVTGGFLRFREGPKTTSTDAAALDGARRYARAANADLRGCFEAWLPDPALDRKRELGGVERMTERHGITIRPMPQKSALGRRFAMVRDVDVIVTIAGKRHTNEVLEQALELNVPALPLPFAGGDSRAFWHVYAEFVVRWFSLTPDESRWLGGLRPAEVARQPRETARTVTDLLGRARIGRCLVLMPFGGAHDVLFSKVIAPAVESVMMCDRLDHRPASDSIRTNFVDAVERASAVIADVTDVNPNVMYELGFALAKGLQPLFYTRRSNARRKFSPPQLPVYLRDLNIAVIDHDDDLDVRIRRHLAEVKASRSAQFTHAEIPSH